MRPANHYAVLGVRKDATAPEIREAYLNLARKHHPDAGGNPAVFKEINTAYSTLRKPAARDHWDRERRMLVPMCRNCQGNGVSERPMGIKGTVRTTCPVCSGTGDHPEC